MIELWKQHGTKLLGVVSMLVGALQAADLYLQALLTPRQHAWVGLIACIVGTLTVRRGFDNDRRDTN